MPTAREHVPQPCLLEGPGPCNSTPPHSRFSKAVFFIIHSQRSAIHWLWERPISTVPQLSHCMCRMFTQYSEKWVEPAAPSPSPGHKHLQRSAYSAGLAGCRTMLDDKAVCPMLGRGRTAVRHPGRSITVTALMTFPECQESQETSRQQGSVESQTGPCHPLSACIMRSGSIAYGRRMVPPGETGAECIWELGSPSTSSLEEMENLR